MAKQQPETRDRYALIVPVQTRWGDNDLYGHVNNVTYYSYFDTVVNRYLIEEAGFDIHSDQIVGYAIETQCRFFSPVAYPEALEAGLRVGHLGRSSVRYELAVFRQGQDAAAAMGHFVHVFVDRRTDQSVAIPDALRAGLEKLHIVPAGS